MDMDDIRAKLAAHHAGAPQRAMMAQLALDKVASGLEDLEALGHRFLFGDEGAPPPVLIFPKMLYRDGEPEVQVHSTDELHDRLADGWREHPSEDIELGPRPNGHAEVTAKPASVDVTTSHPLAQSLAAPSPAQPLAHLDEAEAEAAAELKSSKK